MADMRGQDGVQGVDIKTSKGTKKLSADKTGRIQVDDPKLVKALKDEGFTMAAIASVGFRVDGHDCLGCGFTSVFRKFTCPKCKVENDFRD
jgi:hypothetical protein